MSCNLKILGKQKRLIFNIVSIMSAESHDTILFKKLCYH